MPTGDNQTKRKTIEYVREQVNKIEPTTQLISKEYINNRQALEFVCGCGETFYKSWDTIQQNGTCKCRSCTRKDGWIYNRGRDTLSKDAYTEFVNKGFIPCENITAIKQKVLCKDDNGYLGRISLENVRLGKHFSVFSIIFNKENLLYNLNVYAQNNGYKTKVFAYHSANRSTDVLIDCICECGKQFTTCVGNFTTQDKVRCETCSKAQSNIEHLVEIELSRLNIYFETQKRFDGCRNPNTGRMLPFDFYIPEKNMCIEVDGQQHYKPSKFHNMTDEDAEKILVNRIYKDGLKDEYCDKNSIKLIRIPYNAFRRHDNNYKEILYELFKQP